MDPIIVRRHGGRWSVHENPQTAPRAEYDTRELAEVAARDLAGETGREVKVEDSPDRLDDTGDPAPADREGGVGGGTGFGVPDEEAPREPQAGL